MNHKPWKIYCTYNEKASDDKQHALVLLGIGGTSDKSCMENWVLNWNFWQGLMWCGHMMYKPTIMRKHCNPKKYPFSIQKDRNYVKYMASYDTCNITHQNIKRYL